ncbi:2-oxo-4-hydroxy-4-carboxy-5-ureidoimidazoline decarboxylase [Nocardioides koreensis]|uniref:2-oxo-4-hydroxy-4-carboxy-5-ureidoimidazoline decarboxylase n=1 Tax=Nocardioides koreensis TaxID=433651 RepID=UPI0031D384A4
MQVTEFNALPAGEARSLVAGCLGVPRWADEVVVGRPYADVDALRKQAHDSALELTDDELAAALSRHPRIGESRIGERRDADDADDAEARHSRAEQSGVGAGHQERLRAANAAYEARFGRVFLIRAAGRSGDEILAELQRRLGNDDAAERAETVTALREIALLRLGQVVA